MNRLLAAFVAGTISVAVPAANAAIQTFVVPLNGAHEAPGPGDPDGSGLATLMIDDVALTIDWNITAADILFPLTGAHIHEAPVAISGPVVVSFGGQLSGSGPPTPVLADVLANPTSYYVNLHNADFPAGAIRGQLSAPIPESTSLLSWSVLAAFFVGTAISRRYRQ